MNSTGGTRGRSRSSTRTTIGGTPSASTLPPKLRRCSSTRSEKPKIEKYEPVAPPPKPKFTAHERLEIVKRIQAGDYIRGAGLEQFYKQKRKAQSLFDSSSTACQKDLANDFAKLDLASPSESLEESAKVTHTTGLGSSKHFTKFPQPDLGKFTEEDEKYSTRPELLKAIDRCVISMLTYFRSQEALAAAMAKQAFSERFLKHRLRSVLKRMRRIEIALQKFLQSKGLDSMNFFMPGASDSAKPLNQRRGQYWIHCHVSKRREVVEAFSRATEILKAIRNAQTPDKDECMIELGSQLEKMDTLLMEYEYMIKELEQQQKKTDKLLVSADTVYGEDSDFESEEDDDED